MRSLVQKPATAPPVVHDVLRAPGRPLEPSVRGPMEARFGHDFSRVRVHTDSRAAESAQAVGAAAYTVGSDVVFGGGRYGPGSTGGADLLAHELGHVVQQRDTSAVPSSLPVSPANDPLERDADAGAPASRASPQVQRQDIGDERVHFEESLPSDPTQTGGVWKGTVERTRVHEKFRRAPAIAPNELLTFDLAGNVALRSTVPGRPARDEWQRESSQSYGQMTLEYDEGACELRIPTRLNFHNPGPGQLPSDPCASGNAAPLRPLPADVFAGLRRGFTSTINEKLNQWYQLKIEGCGAAAPCSRGVSIRVVATDGGGTGPQADVWLINVSGRSCAQPATPAAFIYAPDGSTDRPMWGHEGGHFVLRYGDEYDEEGRPEARVHEEDYSGMASRNLSRLALLHERHFDFAPLFVNRVMALSGRSCRASLEALPRPSVGELGGAFSAGYLTSPGGRGLYLDLGLQIAAPLTRTREWETIIGVHGRLLVQMEKENQAALLVGVRAGLERTIPLGRFGKMLNLGAYGELGEGLFDLGGENVRAPYGEVGGYARLRLGTGPTTGFVGFEAARGGRLDLTGPPDPGTAGPTEWTRYGFWLGIRH